jgi:flagellar basal-body rod protein FlgC
MGFFKSLDISASGLSAQRFRMDIISENIANYQTTHTADGTPYVRKYTIFQEREGGQNFADALRNAYATDAGTSPSSAVGGGVRVVEVREDTAPFRLDYDPTHPDALEDGYVRYPNVEMVTEMVDMMSAYRSYEAGITAMQQTKAMAMKALDIGK